MWQEILVPVAVVVALVLFQVGLRYIRLWRVKRWWHRASQSMEAGDLAKASQALHRCVKLMPLWVPARILLASVQASQGNTDDAEKELKLAAQLEPKSAEGHAQLALFYATYRPERDEDARESLRLALKFDPNLRERIRTDPRLKAIRNHKGLSALLQES